MAETTKNIYTALLKVQEKAILPKKKSKGVYDNLYANLEETWEACRKLLNDNQLVISQYVYGDNIVTKLIYIPSGEVIKSKTPLHNPKGDMQGLGSAITYARRYAPVSYTHLDVYKRQQLYLVSNLVQRSGTY